MASHVNDKNHIKIKYDNFQSALLQCNKHNGKVENLGKRKMVPYLCKICNKVHTGHHSKKIITFKVQESALKKINDVLSISILIKKIDL